MSDAVGIFLAVVAGGCGVALVVVLLAIQKQVARLADAFDLEHRK